MSRVLVSSFLILLLFASACGDDDTPTGPEALATGTITLDPSPDAAAAPWALPTWSWAQSGAQIARLQAARPPIHPLISLLMTL